MKRSLSLCLLASGVILIGSQVSHATSFTYDFNYEFSGGSEPSGPTPWLTATVDDHDTIGTVDITLESSGLTGDEFVGSWYFNLNPILDPIALLSGFTADETDAHWLSLTAGANTQQADGDTELYDYRLEFQKSQGAGRFNANETFTGNFNYTGLSASDFDFTNEDGPFTMAAHIQGIDPGADYSGWIATTPSEMAPVPEPATMLLFGTGLAGLAGYRKRKAMKK